MLLLLLIFPILVLAPFFWWFLHTRKHDSVFKNISGPVPLPFIGNGNELGRSPREILQSLNKLCKEYGNVFRIYVGPVVKVIFARPKEVEFVLSSTKHLTKTDAYALLQPWFGDGLITSNGQKWKQRRRLVNPCFHLSVVAQFLDIFNENSDILVGKLEKFAGKGCLDVFPFVNLCSMDILCETSMGVKVDAQKNENHSYVKSVRGFIDIFAVRVFSMWKQFELSFKLSPDYKFYKEYLHTMHNFTRNVIKQKREDYRMSRRRRTSEDDEPRTKTALLEMLLNFENDNILTNADIREEIDTFMAAGHDTISTAVAFTMLCLAQNEEIQRKAFEEIETVIGAERDLTMQHVQSLKYLELVIKEAMRLYPPVPYIERKLQAQSEIHGQVYPIGTIVAVYIYGLHHNPDVFPCPEKFDPDRFLPANRTDRPVYGYVPFSAGPRNCIGQRIAMLEVKTLIAKILKRFKLVEVPGFKVDLGLTTTLKAYNGICLQVEDR